MNAVLALVALALFVWFFPQWKTCGGDASYMAP